MLKNLIYKLLRRSEKYTQTDMVYLAKGGFWLTFGQAISAASAFVLAIIFANLLPQYIYGNYKYVMSIAGILAIFTLPGINTAITQAVAKNEKVNTKSLSKFKIKYGLIASAISLAIGIYYFVKDNNIFAACFSILAILIPLTESFTLYAATLNGLQFFKKLNIRNSIIIIIHSLVLGISLIFTQNIIILISLNFSVLLILRFVVSHITEKENPSQDDKNTDIKKYGQHLSIAQSINTIGSQIDKILIYQYLGAAELAIYFMAITPVDQVKQVVKNIVPLTLPKLSQRSDKELDKSLGKKLIMTGISGILLTGIYIILAPIFFKYFVPQYIDSTPFSITFSIMILLQSISSMLASVLRAQKMTKIIHQNTIIQNILLILLMISMGYYYGIMGVILAKLIAMMVSIIIRIILWKKAVNKNIVV